MPIVTVTAAEGEALRVRVQKRVEKASIVHNQGFDENGVPAVVTSFGPKQITWPDQEIHDFASESRKFEVGADQRLVVEGV